MVTEAQPELSYGWFSFKPKWLQAMNNCKCFLFIAVMIATIQGMTVSGITGISLPALEKRFQLTSKDLGVISASNDISAILLICFVSFYGQFGNKIKWIGYGAIITGERRIVKFKKRYILICLRKWRRHVPNREDPTDKFENPIFVFQLTIFFSYGSTRLIFSKRYSCITHDFIRSLHNTCFLTRYFDTWCHEMASDPVDKDFILSVITHGFHRVLPLASLQRKLTLIKRNCRFSPRSQELNN